MPVESLPNLPAARDILIDANVFIYAFGHQSAQCLDLLKRCALEEVTAITTVEIINEVCHRMMMAEAVATGIVSRDSAVTALKGKKREIRGLTQYWQQTVRIFSLNILVLNLEEARIHQAHRIRTLHGLMPNDSLILAAAVSYGIDCLATRDDDFDDVPDFTVYKPTDL